MSADLEGKVVLVTGAASGLGAATVHDVLACGGRVVAMDLSRDVMALAGERVMPVVGDAADERQVLAAVRAGEDGFARVNGAVAAAGITRAGTVDSMDMDTWNEVLRVNLTSVFLLAKACLPAFRRAGGGALVAVASQVGLVGYPENVAYCAAKAGVINLVRAIAVDERGSGVRAVAVCPGPVDTPMLREGFAQTGESYELAASRVPLGRVAKPEEISGTICFLLSDQAAFVTGTAWTVDGGYTAH
ncbi:SDR family NAD(P)-dependent oxidoreductase [Herbidospora yilanensis]|uniref:SDR family NAD(P)-dependent oxidoreductase n=1 Tax=Herbidospora yilanensis TaxID=354426 RepID=UPI000782A45D|nr:SDR family NAD(P)-dependent oxidoreductase [Herbidospora yilanensis]